MTIRDAEWEKLPHEIWLSIFENLPLKGQVSLACTCSKLYGLSLDRSLDNIGERAWIYLQVSRPVPYPITKSIQVLRIPSPQTEEDSVIKRCGEKLKEQISLMKNLRRLILDAHLDTKKSFLSLNDVYELLSSPNLKESLEEFRVPEAFLHTSTSGKNILHVAAMSKNLKVMSSILAQLELFYQQEGKNYFHRVETFINLRDEQENTPLQLALQQGDKKMALLLLRKGGLGKQYPLFQEPADLSLAVYDSEGYGDHWEIESFHQECQQLFFTTLKKTTNLMSLRFSESFFQDLQREKRLSFFEGLAEVFQENGEKSLKIFLLDLRACRGLTTQELDPLLDCKELEELWLPPSLIDFINSFYQNPLSSVLHAAVKKGNKKIAASFISQGVSLSSIDDSGYTSLSLAQELEVKGQFSEMTSFLERAALEKIGQIAFDKRNWEKYYGFVEKQPPLPSNILSILESPCPIWFGKKIYETHLLVLIPEKINQRPLTLNYLGELIQRPKEGGYATKYRYYWPEVREEMGAISPSSSYWVLMTRQVLPNTAHKSLEEQMGVLSRLSARVQERERQIFLKGYSVLENYRAPKALEAAVCILTEYVRKGVRLYSNPEGSSADWASTRCERIASKEGHRAVIGGFSKEGLYIYHDRGDTMTLGLGGLRVWKP